MTDPALDRYSLTPAEEQALRQATPWQIASAFLDPIFLLRFAGAVVVGFARGLARGFVRGLTN